MRQVLAVLVVLAVMATAPTTASAAWTRISSMTGYNIDEPSLVRSADGTLHVAYIERPAIGETSGKRFLRHRALSLNGRTWSGTATINGPINSSSDPSLALIGSTLYAFWGGDSTANTSVIGKARFATYTTNGWVPSPAPMSVAGVSNPFASTVTPDGTPWIAWSSGFSTRVHGGFDAGTVEEQDFADADGDASIGIGSDARTGEVFLLQEENTAGRKGMYVRRVAPTVSAPVRLSSAALVNGYSARHGRIATASPPSGGVYTVFCNAYPFCNRLGVVSTKGKSLPLSLGKNSASLANVTLTTDPSGRLWLVWATYGEGLWATRSNRAITRWGAPRRLGKFAGNKGTVWSVAANANAGALDLIVNASPGGTFTDPYVYHQRILPGLTITVVSRRTDARGRRTVTLRAHDAGAPVRARFTLLGKAVTANKQGLVRFTVPANTRAKRATATARRVGYAPGTLSVPLR